jgi:hypothetical protein
MFHSGKRATDLEAKFQEFNLLNFQGRLKARRIYRATPKRWAREAHGECLPEKITVREGLGEKTDHETLLHEMVHVKAGPSHGTKFVDELKRLRSLGAPLSSIEGDLKEGIKPVISRQFVGNIVDDCLTDHLKPKQIYRALEEEFCMPISVLKHRINVDRIISTSTMAKREWERLRAKATRNRT